MANWSALGQMAEAGGGALNRSVGLILDQQRGQRDEKRADEEMAMRKHDAYMRDVVAGLDMQVKRGQIADAEAARQAAAASRQFKMREMQDMERKRIAVGEVETGLAAADYMEMAAESPDRGAAEALRIVNGFRVENNLPPHKNIEPVFGPDGKLVSGKITRADGTVVNLTKKQLLEIRNRLTIPAKDVMADETRRALGELSNEQKRQRLEIDRYKAHTGQQRADTYQQAIDTTGELGRERNAIGWSNADVQRGTLTLGRDRLEADEPLRDARTKNVEADTALTGAQTTEKTGKMDIGDLTDLRMKADAGDPEAKRKYEAAINVLRDVTAAKKGEDGDGGGANWLMDALKE